MCGPKKQPAAAKPAAPAAPAKPKAPTPEQKQADAAAKERMAADEAARQEAENRAKIKQEDIQEAVSAKIIRKGMSGGSGRRSLFSSSAAGFLGRFM
jgi:hypothetical protein